MIERSRKLLGVWQRVQSAPSSPRCTSVWQPVQVLGVRSNSSEA
jgi:hypothetical protein